MRELKITGTLICLLQLTFGEYELRMRIHSLNNPNTIDVRGICCEFVCLQRCDYYFSICQRPAGTPISYSGSVNEGNCSTTSLPNLVMPLDERHNFSDPLVFLTTGNRWENEGVQIFIELGDEDIGSVDTVRELIDRFVINVSLPVCTATERRTYSGIFGKATVDVSLELNCAENYYDENCDRFCEGNCTCSPGTTGPCCALSIDDCVNVTCEENEMCEDGLLNSSCVCESGYTGLNCMEDISECEEVECINGICEEGIGNFTCFCTSGYTGQFCETRLNTYQVHITIHSLTNTGLTSSDPDNGCCDGCSRTSCDYYITYCLRPVNTRASRATNPYQGNCSGVQTTPIEIIDYTNATFSLPDQLSLLSLSGGTLPPDGIQLHLEVVDHDPNGGTDDLIDRFTVDITSREPISGLQAGIFQAAMLNMTVEIVCAPEFTEEFCEMNIFPSTTSDSPITGREMTLALALGISAAAVVLAILVAIVFIFVRLKRHKLKSNLAEITVLGAGNRSIECRPSLAYIMMTDGRIPPKRENSVVYNAYSEIDDDYYYSSQYWAPAEKRSDLLEQLKKLKIRTVMEKDIDEKVLLGRGAFGQVYKGTWYHAVAGSEEITEEVVAVKTMEDANEQDSVKFLQEATIMGQFSHVNIVKILAIVIAGDNMCKIVMEFMTKGDLKNHLRTMVSRFPDTMELSSQLLYYSRQVASGVSYLSSKGYVHRDLAARNVFVSGDDMCKIGDFGLSRELQKVNQTYLAGKGGKIPLKWTAPEALIYGRYSTASDIWSFGCVLYEIWSLGIAPFSKFNINEAFLRITSNYRLPPPPGCPRSIYEVMIKCWHSEADVRPDAEDICSQLNRPEFRVLTWSSEDKANYSEMARTVGMPLEEGERLFEDLQQS